MAQSKSTAKTTRLIRRSLVETGKASAILRLDKGEEITLSSNARTTLHHDRLVLQHGSGEWTGPGSFPFESNGLLVTPATPASRGIVSLNSANTLEVATLIGELRITNRRGVLLAGLRQGDSASFAAPQAGAASPQSAVPMRLYGTLTKVDGHFYLELPKPDLGVKYEVNGANLDKLVGKQVLIKGTANLSATGGAVGAVPVIAITTVSEILPLGAPILGAVIIGTSIAAGAAAVGVGVFVATQSSTPASR